MAIKGVSDVARLPRLGKIRLGIKVKGERSAYPRQVDYFVCPDEVKQVYREKPKELRILFPTEDENQWASQFYRCYSQTRGLICKGDGESANALIDEETGVLADRNTKKASLRDISCDPEHCPYYGKQCRMVMNLQFLLPDVPGLGVWQIDTSSVLSITNINNGMRKTVHVLILDTPYTLIEMLKYAQMPPGKAILPAPDTEPPEDLFPSQVIEEASEQVDEAIEETTPEATNEESQDKPEADEPVLRNLGDLFQACHQRYGMKPAQVLKELGLSSKEEIADAKSTWEQIKKQKNNGGTGNKK